MAHVYPTNEEQCLPEVHETLAVYGSTPRYAPTMHVEDTDRMRQRFEESYQRWKRESWMFSSPRALTSHPDFRTIVEMGRDAVPYILDKLEKEPSPLVWALNRIYDRSISEGKYLSIPQLAQKWLQILRN